MTDLTPLIDLLAGDLAADRPLSAAVIAHIGAEYNFPADELDRFFTVRFPSLEEFEVEICLARLFTPDVDLQARAFALIPDRGLSPAEEQEVVRRLGERAIVAPLRSGSDTYPMVVAPVLLERYVRLLTLSAPLAGEVAALLDRDLPEAERAAARHACRLPQWQGKERTALLRAWLTAAGARGSLRLDRLLYLTGVVKSYRPHDLADLDRQLTNLADALANLDLTPFYSDELKESYAATHPASDHLAARRAEIAREQALLHALRADLAAMAPGNAQS
ncbi:MAG: hypothetical protein GW783_00265 [Deltaproteobacteria bacterium]|nr:hypothetical protein [Deltaproteobacteria bacterium]OIP66463.1 MAG: hypothetical protein AUK30_02395 [Nitrospirae bacterium CG2_30_70_394]PIU80248.1 MAG: hypothetical protein COS73_00255 [Nitrospirae bacterium CG06_land_8_20_14_3_00_70_43]PIW83034.1 MAG: hypothetical protein COZ96_05515 [Nitrospirae bacterium CG_4_8_14_3_um_filter_70_85]PIX84344.1 MAG: hypothetical protein COZ33_00760 [Nitrospirae bacterium CG_4_10_14_3_um_filter_70_108]PJB96456.1 MAG: hypothetical protein CO080_03150 [Nitr